MTVHLRGLGLLITRPAGQAGRLAQMIQGAGGEALLYPTIEIVDTDNPRAAQLLLASLKNFDRAIFVSANAVEKAFLLLSSSASWPQELPAAAIGMATADALCERGIKNILTPQAGFDSEALLELPEFQSVINSRIVIFRGQGGRDTLKQTLTARGATVTYCECYRRLRPNIAEDKLVVWLKQKKIHAINVMSSESLSNLLQMAGDAAPALKSISLVTHHPRVAQAAKDAGFTQVITSLPGNTALMAVLEALSLGKLLA
ncbi:MAG: uroporphyrinogen-III synthase [Burkholderiales bacterium]